MEEGEQNRNKINFKGKRICQFITKYLHKNLLLKHLIGDSITLFFLVYLVWLLYDLFWEITKNIDLFFAYSIVFLYSLTLSFSIVYRQSEKALKMVSVLLLLVFIKELFLIFKNFYLIVLLITSGYYIDKQLEKTHISFILIEYTIINIATILIFNVPKYYFRPLSPIFIIFAAITLLVHVILYIRLPSEILGYDLVIARIPTNISLNILHDVLNDPLITVDKTIVYENLILFQ